MENHWREIAAARPKTSNILKNIQNKINRKNYTNIKSLIETIERLPIKNTQKNNLFEKINVNVKINNDILEKLFYLRRLGKVNPNTIKQPELNRIITKLKELGLGKNENIKNKLSMIILKSRGKLSRMILNN
jgi:hypothetical protein